MNTALSTLSRKSATNPLRTHDRLYRRTIEIRDSVLTLADHAPAELRGRAYDHATSLGFIGAHADMTAKACWLAVAREERLRGAATGSGEPMPPASGGRDLATEIRALTTLSTAYRSRATQDLDVLDGVPKGQVADGRGVAESLLNHVVPRRDSPAGITPAAFHDPGDS
ncbi:DUF6545 domain-containing protein [Streptomyces atratus]|uniref:DUF6545 domain-containing protein n=1 Tax=Streptomyces atratus TaxID=1893 RepID=UPI003F53F0C0